MKNQEEFKGSGHYMVGGIEVLDIMKAKMTKEQYEGFLLGNVIKYALRYNWREERTSDMRKCLHYCELLMAHLVRTEIPSDPGPLTKDRRGR